jgi:hypothetical protein
MDFGEQVTVSVERDREYQVSVFTIGEKNGILECPNVWYTGVLVPESDVTSDAYTTTMSVSSLPKGNSIPLLAGISAKQLFVVCSETSVVDNL